MNSVGNVSQLPVLPSAPRGGSSTGGDIPLPRPASSDTAVEVKTEAAIDTRAIERQRLARVQRAAGDIANVFVVSDRRFTIFKDATGQYVTRFTSLRDGRVTYIPEPELLKRGSSSASLLNTLA